MSELQVPKSEFQVPKSEIQVVLIGRYCHVTIYYWFGIQLNI